MDLEKVFEHMSKKMNIEWDRIRESLSHSGLKGTSLEKEFKKFLRDYLPKSIEISSGQIVDSNGKQSKQIDIILHDSQKTPYMYDEDDTQVIPIECVYAVIEVKSNIDSTKLVQSIFENMKSVKDLEKISYVKPQGAVQNFVKIYGKEWDIWPVHYFVFALDSMKLVTIGDELERLNKDESRDVEKRIDCVCVLNKGVLLNKFKDEKLSAFPEEGSSMIASLTTKPLLFFYRLISGHLYQVTMPPFQIEMYLKDVRY